MKYGVNRQILLIIAGTVWIIAGGNILRIGIVTWMNNSHDWMFKIGEATIVFLLFFVKDSTTSIPAGLNRRKKPATVLSLSSM